MKLITDQNEIQKLRNDKIHNDFQLAKDICAVFDENPALRADIQELTHVALRLVSDVVNLLVDPKYSSDHKEDREKLLTLTIKVVRDERFLKFWNFADPEFSKKAWEVKTEVDEDGKKVSKTVINPDNEGMLKTVVIPSIDKIKAKKDWNTQQCGEIVRLFAGLCDELGKSAPKALSKLQLAKVDAKGTVSPLVELSHFCSLRGAYRTTEWGEYAFDATRRTRDKANPGTFNTSAEPSKTIGTTLGIAHDVKTGITIWTLKAGSVTRVLDKLLGLPEGADISGTTADTIFAVESLLNMLYGTDVMKRDSNLLLFPMAAIVSGYHHTILEVALVLALNHITPGYIIGAYQTMLPRKTKSGDPANDVAIKLASVLKAAEESPKNATALFYKTNAGEERALVFEKADQEDWRKYFQMNTQSYKRFGSHFGGIDEIRGVDIAKILLHMDLTAEKLMAKGLTQSQLHSLVYGDPTPVSAKK